MTISYLDITIFFLAASLILYTLLGGADFGAGIVEFLVPSSKRDKFISVTKEAMGPVWEANHMWLILAVVILFNGFPSLYSRLSTLLHVPLTLMLMGIIFRGCAFTFRHYDAIQDESNKIYSSMFQLSSILTPMMIGMMVAAITEGRFVKSYDAGYYEIYIAPWCSVFSVLLGLFTVALFTLLATIYLIGEVEDRDIERSYKKLAFKISVFAFFNGLAVLLTGKIENESIIYVFLRNKLSIAAMVTATLFLMLLYYEIKKRRRYSIRVVAALIVTLIVFGWFDLIFPNLISYVDSDEKIGLSSAAAGDETLKYLTYALLFGSIFIFPSLFYLFKVFKLSSRKIN